LEASGFSLQLQRRHEPFGLTVIESMRAGCLPVVSTVGAFPELVDDRADGLIVEGDAFVDRTQRLAAELVLQAVDSPDASDQMRARARRRALSVDQIAARWAQDWACRLAQLAPQLQSAAHLPVGRPNPMTPPITSVEP
jgi:glycosyltransferase involved in cell wall biosynthesis